MGLRQAIADTLANKYGLQYDPATEILVTKGVTEGISVAITAITNPGDIILVPTPTFSIYTPDVMIAGGTPVEVDTSKTGFKLTPALLKQYLDKYDDRVKGGIFVNPSNPTGIAYTQAEMN